MPDRKAYTVDKKDPRIRFTTTGEQYTVYRIWATTAGGTTMYVEIPEADLDRAEEILTTKAKQLDAIK